MVSSSMIIIVNLKPTWPLNCQDLIELRKTVQKYQNKLSAYAIIRFSWLWSDSREFWSDSHESDDGVSWKVILIFLDCFFRSSIKSWQFNGHMCFKISNYNMAKLRHFAYRQFIPSGFQSMCGLHMHYAITPFPLKRSRAWLYHFKQKCSAEFHIEQTLSMKL